MAEQERNSRMDHEIRKELHTVEEESRQKDLLLQIAAKEDANKSANLQDLQARLARAEASYREQSMIDFKHQMIQEELQQKNQVMQQEVQAKTAQVKQYKKQIDLLQEKQCSQVTIYIKYVSLYNIYVTVHTQMFLFRYMRWKGN